MGRKIRVLIADDHTMVRQGLSQICGAETDIEVAGQASSGEEACWLAERLAPNVVIMDINMPGMDGVQATKRITAANPRIGVIILTMYRQDQYVFEAIRAGARAYLLKDAHSDELLQAIRHVAEGEALLDPAIARKMIDEFRRLQAESSSPNTPPLPPRDLQVLRLAAQGLDNHQIAGQLQIAEKTVRNRLSMIFEKLQVDNRTQAVLYALRKGLARLDDDPEVRE